MDHPLSTFCFFLSRFFLTSYPDTPDLWMQVERSRLSRKDVGFGQPDQTCPIFCPTFQDAGSNDHSCSGLVSHALSAQRTP
jgi:hypothetical protein